MPAVKVLAFQQGSPAPVRAWSCLSKEEAEAFATRKRAEAKANGWNMRIEVVLK